MTLKRFELTELHQEIIVILCIILTFIIIFFSVNIIKNSGYMDNKYENAIDFIPKIGSPDAVEFTVSQQENWTPGTVIGIDVETNSVKIKTSSGHSHWSQIYFQLNRNNPKFFKVRPVSH